jgi:hypothetical protein
MKIEENGFLDNWKKRNDRRYYAAERKPGGIESRPGFRSLLFTYLSHPKF